MGEFSGGEGESGQSCCSSAQSWSVLTPVARMTAAIRRCAKEVVLFLAMPKQRVSCVAAALSMPRGDVGVLKRLERECRRADRSSRKIEKILSAKRRPVSQTSVHARTYENIDFATPSALCESADLVVAKRRLSRARTQEGKRAFSVCEVSGDDAPRVVVAMETQAACSGPALAACLVGKAPSVPFQLSQRSVSLFSDKDGELYARKLSIVSTRQSILYVTRERGGLPCPPKLLGLDRSTYSSIQLGVAKAAGLCIANERSACI